MRKKFNFSLLRYTYDVLTQEFVTVGAVVFFPEDRYLKARLSLRHGRLSKMFGAIDGTAYRSLINYIETKIIAMGNEIQQGNLFIDSSRSLEGLLSDVLPSDDSAVQFVSGGTGLSESPERTLVDLYERYVTRFEKTGIDSHRDENDVWKVFQAPLQQKTMYSGLVAKTISTSNYEFEFERCWKNGIWHVFQPISFDLSDNNHILDKANTWLGRATSLSDSAEKFKLYVLLGEPRNPQHSEVFIRAQNLLTKIPGQREFIHERDAQQFADEMESEYHKHVDESE